MGLIPIKYTADGDNISPPLEWKNVRKEVKSFVLIVDDPDAPDPRAPLMIWVHWILYNIPSDVRKLPEGILKKDLPAGTKEGRNDWNNTGYGGPSPPIGRHRYFFRLYALDIVLPDLGKPTRAKLELAMEKNVIAKAELVGTYQRL